MAGVSDMAAAFAAYPYLIPTFPIDDRLRTVPTICQDATWDLASGGIREVWQEKINDT
jgi:hypothetical protein